MKKATYSIIYSDKDFTNIINALIISSLEEVIKNQIIETTDISEYIKNYIRLFKDDNQRLIALNQYLMKNNPECLDQYSKFLSLI